MYVLRRIFQCKPGEARRVASLVQKQAEAFEAAGQRSECRVYFNGATTPAEQDVVVLEWTDEVLRSTFRAGLTLPQAVRDIGGQVAPLTESNRLEIMELMTPDKMMDV